MEVRMLSRKAHHVRKSLWHAEHHDLVAVAKGPRPVRIDRHGHSQNPIPTQKTAERRRPFSAPLAE